MRQILRCNVNASNMQLIQSVREIVYGLCGHRIGHEFTVDDRLFLVRRTVRLQAAFAAKIQEFRELMVALNFCGALVASSVSMAGPGDR